MAQASESWELAGWREDSVDLLAIAIWILNKI
jgi:hypothetical protein